MTIAQFLEELKEHGIKFELTLKKYIRDRNGDCPICALVKAKGLKEDTGNVFATTYGHTLLNLTVEDSCNIVTAADGFPFLGLYCDELRERLINDYK